MLAGGFGFVSALLLALTGLPEAENAWVSLKARGRLETDGAGRRRLLLAVLSSAPADPPANPVIGLNG